MFDHAVQICNMREAFKLFQKIVKVFFFKDDFRVAGFRLDRVFRKPDEPVEILLQGQTAGENDVFSVIQIELQPEKLLIEAACGVYISHGQQRASVFHTRSFLWPPAYVCEKSGGRGVRLPDCVRPAARHRINKTGGRHNVCRRSASAVPA